MNLPILQCLTQDGLPLSHEAQVRALVAAGAGWIQLRMKAAPDHEVAAVAAACLPICRDAGCRLVINDRIHVALEVGVDGVHLGKLDMAWTDAARFADGKLLLGGTVNSVADAEKAVAAGVLDYVGVGPFRFTQTKANLADVLTAEDWSRILHVLGGLPAYAIGGLEPEDLATVRALGCSGAAVCSQLYRGGEVAENFKRQTAGWGASGIKVEGMIP